MMSWNTHAYNTADSASLATGTTAATLVAGEIRELRMQLERLTLMNQALWELLQERLHLSDAELEQRVGRSGYARRGCGWQADAGGGALPELQPRVQCAPREVFVLRPVVSEAAIRVDAAARAAGARKSGMCDFFRSGLAHF
ncbi:MAG: hypothetical protein HC888_16995 [Candidatus Competibacteraceae bacterium]|nr:hypothetical protein [Candidatus Competibacteraceae bacterium]